MKTFSSIESFCSENKTIVTIGTFDGVHVGHQKIIQKLVQAVYNTDYQSLILTFFPHPRLFFNPNADIKLLSTLEEKTQLLEKQGLHNLIIQTFDKAFSELSAEEFVTEILIKKLNVYKIIIGHDHRFGKNKTANIDDLIFFGKKYGFLVEQIYAQKINHVAVSSSKIRLALLDSNTELANQYLGYSYFFSGKVVKGKQLGRTIGYPTANLEIDDYYKLIPKTGVYIVKCLLDQNWVYGMMNIGYNPTIGNLNRTIEVHFLNFNSDLYQKVLTIYLLDFIREEQKFENLEALKKQLDLDKTVTFEYCNQVSK